MELAPDVSSGSACTLTLVASAQRLDDLGFFGIAPFGVLREHELPVGLDVEYAGVALQELTLDA